MPWKVIKSPIKSSNKDWAIVKQENGSRRIVGRSTSKKAAKASVRARQASEHSDKKK